MPTTINPADQSINHYSILTGGANNTLNNVAPGLSGTALFSNGASSQPTFQSIVPSSGFTQIAMQVFTSSGTYTPTAGMVYCFVQVIGSGGGGGNSGANQVGSGGGAGAYSEQNFTASTIGVSQTVTIGIGGTATNNGNSSSFGSLIVCGGGSGGISNISGQGSSPGGVGGTVVSGGTLNVRGESGRSATANAVYIPGAGGSSYFCAGGGCGYQGSNTGFVGQYGSGGGGGYNTGTGGAGGNGVIIVTEYI